MPSVSHFFSLDGDRPLNFFQKILRIFTTEASFFSLCRDRVRQTPNLFSKNTADFHYRGLIFSLRRDRPLTFFHKILRVLSSVRHFFSVARDTFNRVIALPTH